MQNQKWTFVFLLWVGRWAFGLGPDGWKHWNHSHRNKTRHLPNRNVLAVSLPHKQAFEGRWAGRRTDGRHSRVSTHSRTRTGPVGPRTWRLEWAMGSQWERGLEGGGFTTGAMHHQLLSYLHKGREKPGREAKRGQEGTGWGGGVNQPLKQNADPTTRFTLETTDWTNHSAGYSRC